MSQDTRRLRRCICFDKEANEYAKEVNYKDLLNEIRMYNEHMYRLSK